MKKFNLLLFVSLLTTALVFTSCEKDEDEDNNIPIVTVEFSGTISENTTWSSDKIYEITGSVYVTDNATLTIEAGTIVRFHENVEIDVASNGFGTIKAIGTADKPILFTSNATTKTKGDWYGLWLYDGSNGCEFAYCTFEYAGGYSQDQAVVNLRSSVEVSFEHCTFRHNDSFGIKLSSDASFTKFNYNSFSDNSNNAVNIYANQVNTMGINNTYDNEILVSGGNITKAGDITWVNQGTPFIIDGDIEVGSTSGTKLILEAGSKLAFTKNSEIGFGYSSGAPGLIDARGTIEKPIIFTSASAYPTRGDWDGIWFYANTPDGNLMDNCIVEYGGGYSDDGNIVFKYNISDRVSISNSTIRYSKGYGLYHQTSSDTTTPTLSNITYTDNTLGDKNF